MSDDKAFSTAPEAEKQNTTPVTAENVEGKTIDQGAPTDENIIQSLDAMVDLAEKKSVEENIECHMAVGMGLWAIVTGIVALRAEPDTKPRAVELIFYKGVMMMPSMNVEVGQIALLDTLSNTMAYDPETFEEEIDVHFGEEKDDDEEVESEDDSYDGPEGNEPSVLARVSDTDARPSVEREAAPLVDGAC